MARSRFASRAQVPVVRHQVHGLAQNAEIIVDRWGVPHIYAQSAYNAVFAQGFNAARDRLYHLVAP